MKIFFLFLLSCMMSWPTFSKEIDPSHRSCKIDDDCQLIILGCACVHNSTCQRPDDKTNGFVAGINKKFADRYSALSKCSASETRSCSMAGACASQGEWLPKCEKQLCTVIFKELKF